VHGFPYPSGEFLGDFLPISEGLISEVDQRKVYGSYKSEDQSIVDKLRLRYDEALANQDQKLTNFIESLKRQGLYDSAMIIITSDHGQSFSNGFTTHCTPLVSNAEAYVPLLIKYPYQTEGQRFDSLVTTLDIAPTILDVTGLGYPDNWFDGISLIKQAASEESNRIVFTRRYIYDHRFVPSQIAATDGKYRLVMRVNELFLFDSDTDPLEKDNLLVISGYEQKPEIQRLKQALLNYQERAQFIQAGGDILSAPSLNSTVSNQP
jgi:arylsulfatase A-like enzyme